MLLSEIPELNSNENLKLCIIELNSINIKTIKEFLTNHYLFHYSNNKNLDLESLKFVNNYLKTLESKDEDNDGKMLLDDRLLLEKELMIEPVSTSFKDLDKSLEGGLYPNKIYEFTGLPGIGKTQLSINIVLNHLLNNCESTILWIQFGNNFPLNLILKELKARLNLSDEDEDEDKLDGIMKRFNLIEIIELKDIEQHLNQIKQTYTNELSLLVIDNASLNFTLNLNNQQLGKGQKFIVSLVSELRIFSKKFNCSIILNNLAKFTLNKDIIQKNGQLQPRFGLTWSYLTDVQIMLYRINQSSKKYFNIDEFEDPLIDISEDLNISNENCNPWLRCYIFKNKFGASNVSCEINLKSKNSY
ncbi:P-loop containing nucleoside triphosphate hydrolase protein [Conidiobolus coronatus NRRL 28638]|uniref:p-loop containing nucleoside triphosphate hydrolase protein n=1 Tax=Conidiobolus coronatus (strain ATCC 28846 / CBS 209.66 / NRRL 28638) TaxID=796925 RepID=A0A137P949_CONC2|nr:P-loop containing nucleoside triphosphate hydrolase protein [Conidiobolus coronatus NRRL 28638]|eukprot:KXN71474.1 P-loop containing nucleoside triphosphate hydrolase protein [Conidiobolus coronatus NRRL 28638]